MMVAALRRLLHSKDNSIVTVRTAEARAQSLCDADTSVDLDVDGSVVSNASKSINASKGFDINKILAAIVTTPAWRRRR